MPSLYYNGGLFVCSGAVKKERRKKMKTARPEPRRILTVFLSLTILLATLVSVCACTKGDVDDVGVATVVVSAGGDVRAYEVPLDKLDGNGGAIMLLDYLEAEGKLDYTAVDGAYGAYLTKVGHLKERASDGIYVGIWTSVESDQDRESDYSSSVTYEGVTLYSSAVGMQQISVPEGAIIYFGELSY